MTVQIAPNPLATRYGGVVKLGRTNASALLVTAGGVTPGGEVPMRDKRITIPCAVCATPFSALPKAVERGRAKFCRRDCYVESLRTRRSPEERFWSRVDKRGGEEACWPYRGRPAEAAHQQLWLNGANIGAHVFSYELHHGPVPDGLWVLHTCDYPPCCNPRHLYAGTPKQNSADRDDRGRANTPSGPRNWTRKYPDQVRRGEDKSQAKLTWDNVREIRRRLALGESQSSLAREFNCYQSVVSRIKSGKAWPLREGERPW